MPYRFISYNVISHLIIYIYIYTFHFMYIIACHFISYVNDAIMTGFNDSMTWLSPYQLKWLHFLFSNERTEICKKKRIERMETPWKINMEPTNIPFRKEKWSSKPGWTKDGNLPNFFQATLAAMISEKCSLLFAARSSKDSIRWSLSNLSDLSDLLGFSQFFSLVQMIKYCFPVGTPFSFDSDWGCSYFKSLASNESQRWAGSSWRLLQGPSLWCNDHVPHSPRGSEVLATLFFRLAVVLIFWKWKKRNWAQMVSWKLRNYSPNGDWLAW